MDLINKVVIVTGGGSGIGKAIAISFAQKGAIVVISGRRESPLLETVEMIRKMGGNSIAIPTDVTDSSQVEKMVNIVLKKYNKIDILINNAGILKTNPVHLLSEMEWDNVIDTDLKSVYLCSKSVLPSMFASGSGIIINISSVLGKTGIANYSSYCASKFGVIGFTESLAAECKEKGILVYSVCPGSTNTELHRSVVGVDAAKFAMSPQMISETIVKLVLARYKPPAGISIILDNPTPLPLKVRIKNIIGRMHKIIFYPYAMIQKIKNMGWK